MKELEKCFGLSLILFCGLAINFQNVECQNLKTITTGSPNIEVYAKSQLLPGGKVTYKSIHKGHNAETIIRPLYFDEEANQWISKPNDNVKTPAIIQMDCSAPYAVEWIYEGNGLTDNAEQTDYPYNFKHATVRTTRIVKAENFYNESSYEFKAQISNLFIREKLTGNYSCRSIENKSILTWMYIYFPENSISFVKSEETRRILLHDSNQVVIVPEYSSSLTLPCSVSHPEAKVSLFKMNSMGSFQKLFLEPSEISFDPIKGFELKNLNYTFLLGAYLCRAENFKSFQMFVYPPKEFIGQFIPENNYVRIDSAENRTFLCKSRENVTLLFSNPDISPEVKYSFSQHSKFPFAVSVVINPLFHNFLRINCTSQRTKQVLHIWEFSSYENKVQFKYDVPNHRILCCADSVAPPKLKALQCHSEMECELKKNFIFEVSNVGVPSDAPGTPGCASLRWVIDEGKLECSLDFLTEKTELSNFNGFISVSPDEQPTSEDIIRIMHDIPYINGKPRDILMGETFSFYCEASSKYFATGSPYVKFGLLKENGTVEILEAPHCRLDACGPNSGIKFDDISIKRVICFAPLYNSSTEWRNASIPIRITDNTPVTIRAVLADKRDGVNFPLMDIPNTDIILRETAMFRNRRLRFECESNFEVIWQYLGSGTPIVKGISNVTEILGNDTVSYKFFSVIEFTKVTDSISGKYTCIVKNKPRLSSYFRVFVPGITAFLNLNPRDVSVTNVDLFFNNDIATIPCPVSDPAHIVTLLAERSEIRNQWTIVSPDDSITFDPLKGFEIKTQLYDLNWNITYICKTDSGHTSGKMHMTSPNEPMFKITPNSIYADNISRLKPAVKCEAKENITLTFNGKNAKRLVLQETDFDAKFPYSVSYFPSQIEEEMDYSQRFSLISCTTIENQTVLHTWSHMPGNYFQPPVTYYYDQNNVRYVCCTNSHLPALLQYVPCAEISECSIRKSCLSHNSCEYGNFTEFAKDNKDLTEDCVGFSIKDRKQGLMRCSVTGDYQEYLYKDFIYSHREDYGNEGKAEEIPQFDESMPSQLFEHNKMIDKNFRIVQTPTEALTIGSTVRFDCYAPKCNEKGLQWSLLAKNGSTLYVNGYDDHNNIEGEENHGWIQFKMEDEEISGVQCFSRSTECAKKWSGLINIKLSEEVVDPTLDPTTISDVDDIENDDPVTTFSPLPQLRTSETFLESLGTVVDDSDF